MIDKALANLTKMSREKTQINKIRNKIGGITTNTKEIQGIIRNYFENLHSNKLENLEEMDKFVDTYDHPKLNQVEINHLNRCITYNEIEAAIVSPKTKVQDLMDSWLNSTRPFFLLLFYYSYVHTMLESFLPLAHTLSLTTYSTPSLSPPPPQYPAETILPLSLILLKREYEQ
jgi:hypothetical protein